MIRKPEILLIVVTFVSAAAALWLWGELSMQRARVAELTARLASFDSASPVSGTPIDTIPRATAAVANVADTPAPASAPRGGSREEASITRDPGEMERRLARNPAYREAWRKKRRLELQTGFRDLQAVLGISREKADEVITYLVESELRGLEKPSPNPTNDEELRQRMLDIEVSKHKREAELTQILGAQTTARFNEFTESMPSRYQAYELRAALGNGAEALRDDQFEPLISAMHAEQQITQQALNDHRRTPVGKDTTPQAEASRREKYDDLIADTYRRVHVAASGILSSTQLAALDDLLRRKRESRAAQENLWRLQAELSENDAVAKLDRDPDP